MPSRLARMKVVLTLIMREHGQSHLSNDEALMLIAECVDKYQRGEMVSLPPEVDFPIWCESWRQSHGEPQMPLIRHGGREA